jgi:type I restriction-modification system DNA methylase subunit
MDASQYKDYVLVLLFVKYVSDKAASHKSYLLDVPKSGSFADMIALKGDKEIGDKMNKIIAKLAGKERAQGRDRRRRLERRGQAGKGQGHGGQAVEPGRHLRQPGTRLPE